MLCFSFWNKPGRKQSSLDNCYPTQREITRNICSSLQGGGGGDRRVGREKRQSASSTNFVHTPILPQMGSSQQRRKKTKHTTRFKNQGSCSHACSDF